MFARNVMLIALHVTACHAFSGEVSSLMRSKEAIRRTFDPRPAGAALAGAGLASVAGAGATAAILPFALQHNFLGAMDDLVAASATSLAYPDASSHVASTFASDLVWHTNDLSCVLILFGFLRMAFATTAPKAKKSLMEVSAAAVRARAAAAMEQADNAWSSGGWFSAVCDEEEGIPPEAIHGPGQVQCLQMEREGRMVWVCV